MSDGISILMMQLGRQHRESMDVQYAIARNNNQLQLHNQQLVSRYNTLLRDFQALQKQSGDRIAALEHQMKAREDALKLARADTDVQRARADLFWKELQKLRGGSFAP